MGIEILGEEKIFHGKVFDLVQVRFRSEGGGEHTYDLVKHHGAVVVLPVDADGNVWFVRQYRLGAEQDLLELPAGVLEKEEAPEASALRELQEEIGMGARNMEKLGEFYMVPGYSTEKMQAYLATDLYESVLPGDEDENLEKVSFTLPQVYDMVQAGKIRDGKTLAVLLLAKQRLERFLASQS